MTIRGEAMTTMEHDRWDVITMLFSKCLMYKCIGLPESTFGLVIVTQLGECKTLFPVSSCCINAMYLCFDRGIIWHCNAL